MLPKVLLLLLLLVQLLLAVLLAVREMRSAVGAPAEQCTTSSSRADV
jgi:hypothetical protein